MSEEYQWRTISRLKASYAGRKDTFPWALAIWTGSAVLFAPFMNIEATLERSILVAVAWSAIHLVRRM
jgi:hypothetical protein